ncbi:MAG: enoyl-CoA hydratase/isomerase family protein [Ramlibacter sp.]|nr:enoyl-CoA hydratase/isomerase family protein [Ramlibacter sp.]
MSVSKLMVERQDACLVITLNRPDKLNAIDNDMARELLAALASASSDDGVRVVLLRGAGRAFCAGRDVSAAPTEEDLALVQAVARAIVALNKPLIAAVHGWTVGAGLEWMMVADVVVAADSARFRLPEASLGVFVTGGLTVTLPASVGLHRAKALMLLGEEFSASDARAWGLAWSVVPYAQLESESLRVAARLAAIAPAVASRFKQVLNTLGLALVERAIELECESQRALG